MIKMKNVVGHLKTVLTHKKWVFYYCCQFGIPFRGLVHDLSKFSPTEFLESVKYYSGKRSPIDICKEKNGYSAAWMHHKSHNKHHYEYWQDNFDKGGVPVQMPFKNALELVCDYLGAGKAYMKDDFSFVGEYKWWENKNKNPIAMHRQTWLFVDMMLAALRDGEAIMDIKYAKLIYKKAEIRYKEETVF